MAKNILWVYGHHEQSGYARNSREFIKALNLNGLNVKFLNIGNLKTYPEYETMKQYEAPADFQYDLVIQNVVPPAFCRIGDVPNILMTVAETDSVDKHWVEACNMADELWTMSYYSKSAFLSKAGFTLADSSVLQRQIRFVCGRCPSLPARALAGPISTCTAPPSSASLDCCRLSLGRNAYRTRSSIA